MPETARHFDIAVAMPNLVPPITDPAAARAYCDGIRAAARDLNENFRPLGIAYLTDNLPAEVLRDGFRIHNNEGDRSWYAAKLYPANATTNSALGVSGIENIYPLLETMEEIVPFYHRDLGFAPKFPRVVGYVRNSGLRNKACEWSRPAVPDGFSLLGLKDSFIHYTPESLSVSS